MNAPDQGRLTGVRREIKFKLDPRSGQTALSRLAEKVPPKEVDGSASSFRVSIYLDDLDRTLSGEVIAERKVVTKLRVREYYVLDGTLPLFGTNCFLEVKTRSGQMVEKSRFPVERSLVESVLQGGGVPASVESNDSTAHAAFETVREGRCLEPIFVVHYRRYTLQDAANRIRITLDDLVSFHAPPSGLLSGAEPICTRRDLPPPFLVEPSWIVEVKTTGPTPTWLDEILHPDRRIRYSKFSAGVQELVRRDSLFSQDAGRP